MGIDMNILKIIFQTALFPRPIIKVSFTTEQGEQVQTRARLRSIHAASVIVNYSGGLGQKVQVLYDPNCPTRAESPSIMIYFVDYPWIMLGGLLTFVGFVLLAA